MRDSTSPAAAERTLEDTLRGLTVAMGQLQQSIDHMQGLTAAVSQLQQSVDRLERRLTIEEELTVVESKSTARFYSFHQNFVAGSIALPLSFAVTHPLDTVKTRMQAASGSAGGTFFSQLRSVFQAKQGAKALGRGFWTSVLGAAPQGGLRFGIYGIVQNKLHPFFDFPVFQNALSAVAGDVASSIVKVPREVLTQRLQTGQYENARQAMRTILRTEGWRGLFTGYWSTTFRDVPFMVVLFVSYEQFKLMKVRFTTTETRRDPQHIDREWSDLETVLWGGFSGMLAGFSTTPLDVIKTRIITETKPGESRSMKAVLSNILAKDGVRGLFIGAGPRSIWWFCVCSVFFSSFERVRTHIHHTFSEDVEAIRHSHH